MLKLMTADEARLEAAPEKVLEEMGHLIEELEGMPPGVVERAAQDLFGIHRAEFLDRIHQSLENLEEMAGARG